MVIDFKHPLSTDDAKARLDALGEYLKNRHDIELRWVDDRRASFTGKYLVVKIEGEVTLEEGIVHFRGKDPGMLWRKKAQSYLEDKLAAYLDPKTPVEALPRT